MGKNVLKDHLDLAQAGAILKKTLHSKFNPEYDFQQLYFVLKHSRAFGENFERRESKSGQR